MIRNGDGLDEESFFNSINSVKINKEDYEEMKEQ